MTPLFVAAFGLQILIFSVVPFTTMSASNGRIVVELSTGKYLEGSRSVINEIL